MLAGRGGTPPGSGGGQGVTPAHRRELSSGFALDQLAKAAVEKLGLLRHASYLHGGGHEFVVEIERGPHADKIGSGVCIGQAAPAGAAVEDVEVFAAHHGPHGVVLGAELFEEEFHRLCARGVRSLRVRWGERNACGRISNIVEAPSGGPPLL